MCFSAHFGKIIAIYAWFSAFLNDNMSFALLKSFWISFTKLMKNNKFLDYIPKSVDKKKVFGYNKLCIGS